MTNAAAHNTASRALAMIVPCILVPLSPHDPLSADQQREFHAEVDLVDVYATVTDKRGGPVRGLTRENFRVLEDDLQQEVSHFSSEGAPYTVGLVLDRSGSMTGVLGDVFDAALHTLQASKPDDEAFVTVFDNQVDLVQDFTLDRKALKRALDKVRPGGETALYDAVRSALRHIQGSRYRKKALLVVTDGADNRSETAYSQLLRSVRQEMVIVYVVGFFAASGRSSDQAGNVDRLVRLAETTGGKAYFPPDMEACKQACLDVAGELRQQYSLGYYPSNKKDNGSWRSIRVEVVGLPPERAGAVSIRARAGYYRSGGRSERGPTSRQAMGVDDHLLQWRPTRSSSRCSSACRFERTMEKKEGVP